MLRNIFITVYVLLFATLVSGQPASFKADRDHAFDTGSGIEPFQLTEQKLKDLELLGKVWGFLKYYHPAVASGQYNWDYELFRILPRIIRADHPAQRDSILTDWVVQLGKTETEVKPTRFRREVKRMPDLDWIHDPELSKELSLQLHRIKNARRSKQHYYIGIANFIGNPVFRHERSYEEMAYPDAGFRLLALYRYWNIIQYYFPYKYLMDEDWHTVLRTFIPRFLLAADELEYKLAVLELIGKVQDTHANIWSADKTIWQYKGLRYPPFELAMIENKAVVRRYYNATIGPGSGLQIGDVILSVNGKPVEELIREKSTYNPASNRPTQLREVCLDLLRTNDTVLAVQYIHSTDTLTCRLKTYTPPELKVNRNFYGPDTCFTMIDPDIGYIFPGKIRNAYLPKIFDALSNTKGLIIDFRCYPSDFIVFSLSAYLLPESKEFVKFTTGSVTMPGLFQFTKPFSAGRKRRNHYKGKVVILVNEKTQSSAEYHTMAFRTAPNATVLGSTTAGADGNVSVFYLPGGIKTMISGIGVYYPDGRETQRAGIVPDIELSPTIEGIRQGRDELLEKAVEIINQ